MASPADKFRANSKGISSFQRGRSSIPGRRGSVDAVLVSSEDAYDGFVPRGVDGEVCDFD